MDARLLGSSELLYRLTSIAMRIPRLLVEALILASYALQFNKRLDLEFHSS